MSDAHTHAHAAGKAAHPAGEAAHAHPNGHENILIIGCGRVGVELALAISSQGHHVTVMDSNLRAFDRLGPDFKGRTVQGDALDQESLKRAGIDHAHGLAAVTTSDSANIVAARIARDIFHVEHVVARVYDPSRTPIYEHMGLQTIASSSWGARRIEQLLLHPGVRSLVAAGNGEVQVYEITVPEAWAGRPLREVLPAGQSLPVALVRGGRALLPDAAQLLHDNDLLLISATAAGAAALRQAFNGGRH
jgi:trk system potassium uptake protein TrkA